MYTSTRSTWSMPSSGLQVVIAIRASVVALSRRQRQVVPNVRDCVLSQAAPAGAGDMFDGLDATITVELPPVSNPVFVARSCSQPLQLSQLEKQAVKDQAGHGAGYDGFPCLWVHAIADKSNVGVE